MKNRIVQVQAKSCWTELILFNFLLSNKWGFSKHLWYTHNTYTYTNIYGNIVNNNDDFNERTNMCVRGELETGDSLLHIDPKVF